MSRHRQIEAPKRALFEAPEPAPDWFDEWEASVLAEDTTESYWRNECAEHNSRAIPGNER